MKQYSFLFLAFLVQFSMAQQTTAQLEKVTEKNFYRIRVSPEIRSASKTNLGDLRIFNSKKEEVPYLIETAPLKNKINQFEAFTFVSKNSVPKKSSSIIIENPKNKINELTLVIANSDINKRFSISGSNDQKQWFGIANKMELFNLNNLNSTEVSTTITFPLCSYKFIKIDFDDTKTLPINVLKVGTTKSSFQLGELIEIEPKDRFVTQLSKDKKTLHRIILNQPQTIDKIVFKVNEPQLFKREVILYTFITTQTNAKTTVTTDVIARFTLSSKTQNEFDIAPIRLNDFHIEIGNQDNPPLEIESIKFYQKPIFIIAQLNENEGYTVVTGNAKLSTPSYDLVYFENEMKNVSREIKMTGTQQQNPTKKTSINKSYWQQSWFMWLCLFVGGITIVFFSIGLVKDLKNN